MGNLIKINIYADLNKRKGYVLDFKNLEANISNYNNWLQKTHREDKIESYEKFLQAK
ncbi:hypothetical protein [Clostridium sp.]|uniref:hypothetical protein n=1 Tax=Clostridium sp. TaxID=1506 RepID=UPI002618016F|nr:hypothetical protein [Clostridium sp.]